MSQTKPQNGIKDKDTKTTQRFETYQKIAQTILLRNAYKKWTPPILESFETYEQSLGEDSDVVSKEMFKIKNSPLVLRPEGTAGLMRGLLSESLNGGLPQKLWYCGPMFRRENPQAGRLREFWQLGAEYIGPNSSICDAEAISTAFEILQNLQLQTDICLVINTLGNTQERLEWKKRLVEYLNEYKNSLSDLSKERLSRNPLRILDSKEKSDQDIIKNAPQIILGEDSQNRWNTLLEILKKLNIPYTIDTSLVRGLDYYDQTVFEFKAVNGLGSQSTILAGGRYNTLAQRFGSPEEIPSIGWAMGLERIDLLSNHKSEIFEDQNPITLISTHDASNLDALMITKNLQNSGLCIDLITQKRLKRALKIANKNGSKTTLIIGPDEMEKKIIIVKNMITGEQKTINMPEIQKFLEEQ